MRGALVAVDDGGEDVLGPMTFLEPVQGIAEVGVLLGPAHGVHGLGAGADEVFQTVDGVDADLLGGALAPGVQDRLAGVGAVEDGVLVPEFEVGDFIYIPGIRSALETDLRQITAFVIGHDRPIKEISLYMEGLTSAEREIIKAGSLINYNKLRLTTHHQ